MKKFYFLLLMLLPMTTLLVAQVGPSFWQFLSADFEENPYPRQELMIQQATDAIVADANSLEELWGQVGNDFIYPIDAWTNTSVNDFSTGASVAVDVPAQSADDFTGSFTMMSGENALYVLYKVVDDEFVAGEDFAEIHFAPYAEKFDPGRELHPQTNRTGAAFQWVGYWWEDQASYSWGWDFAANEGAGGPFGWSTVHTGANYVEMAKYGSWTEVGAYKVDLQYETSAAVSPPALIYSLNGSMQDTLGDVTNGTLPSPMQTVFEATADGYHFLAVIPWELMPTGKLENVGDQISIALKANDYDSDNFEYVADADGNMAIHNHNQWGATDHNDAYWAIAYYGAVATLTLGPLADEEVNLEIAKAYYSNDNLIIKDSKNTYNVSIYDLNGKIVGQYYGKNQINVSFLHAGYYVASISDDKGNRSVVRFVKSTY